jgi:hypothetical protein
MTSSFLPYRSVRASWQDILASFETLERQEAAYLYPWLGEVIQASGYVAASRYLESLTNYASQQAGRLQALQWLVEDLNLPGNYPLDTLRSHEDMQEFMDSMSLASLKEQGMSLKGLEWAIQHAGEKQVAYRTLLAPLAHAEQDPRCIRLIDLIFYAEERASRQLRDLQLALPLQGLFYEEETTSSLTQ